MKLENICVSLKLAKELHYLNWNKETYFSHLDYSNHLINKSNQGIVHILDEEDRYGWSVNGAEIYFAPTLEEIMEELSMENLKGNWFSLDPKENGKYEFMYSKQNGGCKIFKRKKLVDGLAQLWIYLKTKSLRNVS